MSKLSDLSAKLKAELIYKDINALLQQPQSANRFLAEVRDKLENLDFKIKHVIGYKESSSLSYYEDMYFLLLENFSGYFEKMSVVATIDNSFKSQGECYFCLQYRFDSTYDTWEEACEYKPVRVEKFRDILEDLLYVLENGELEIENVKKSSDI